MPIRNTVCEVDGCDTRVKHRGLCTKHYFRWWRHGDPTKTEISPTGEALAWISTNLGTASDECLTWPFSKDTHGYGRVRFRGLSCLAHRVMCILVHGEPPTPQHQAAHSCGKGHEGCVNPRHLRWATSAENQADKIAHGTITHGENHPSAKLTEQQVREARIMSRTHKFSQIAEKCGVSESTISRAINGKNWARVTDESQS